MYAATPAKVPTISSAHSDEFQQKSSPSYLRDAAGRKQSLCSVSRTPSLQDHRSSNDTLCPRSWRQRQEGDTPRSRGCRGERNAAEERGSLEEMVSGCGRTERCYIQIRVEDGMRGGESRRVVVVFSAGQRTDPVCIRAVSFLHTAANTRTYGRWIVFKTAGGSQALEPSCDLVLPQRPGPIALRLQAEFQYTRIFNERSPPSPPSRPRLAPFSSMFLIPDGLSPLFPSPVHRAVPFLIVFLPPSRRPLQSSLRRHHGLLLFPRSRGFYGLAPPIPGELVRSAAESAFYISPPRIGRSRVCSRAGHGNLSPVKRPWPLATLSPAGAFDVHHCRRSLAGRRTGDRVSDGFRGSLAPRGWL